MWPTGARSPRSLPCGPRSAPAELRATGIRSAAAVNTTASPSLRLQLLGAAAWSRDDARAVALERRDAGVLAYLALEGKTPRARLLELLWPDVGREAARNHLRQRLHRLKRAVGADLVEGAELLSLAPEVTVDACDAVAVGARRASARARLRRLPAVRAVARCAARAPAPRADRCAGRAGRATRERRPGRRRDRAGRSTGRAGAAGGACAPPADAIALPARRPLRRDRRLRALRTAAEGRARRPPRGRNAGAAADDRKRRRQRCGQRGAGSAGLAAASAADDRPRRAAGVAARCMGGRQRRARARRRRPRQVAPARRAGGADRRRPCRAARAPGRCRGTVCAARALAARDRRARCAAAGGRAARRARGAAARARGACRREGHDGGDPQRLRTRARRCDRGRARLLHRRRPALRRCRVARAAAAPDADRRAMPLGLGAPTRAGRRRSRPRSPTRSPACIASPSSG